MLDIQAKQNTKYAISLWQRDEQIKLAIQRVKARVHPYDGIRDDPCAVVGFGPSLRDTWEQIREFRYIFTCSGSHPFLIERGIIPTWHVAVDPLPKHTERLIGQPHRDVEYLIASTCHPGVWDHLDGYTVKLWHIFDNSEESIRTLPQGEWSLTGGIDAGLRCITLARFFGFTDVHLFGIDASSPEQGYRHAADHPTSKLPMEPVTYEGRTFLTTPGMLAAAQGIWHELNQLHDLIPTFHGDGLIQHMAKTWEKKPQRQAVLAFHKPELISAEYRALNQQLFATSMAYGVGGGKHAPVVLKLVEALKPSCDPFPTVLDYGCGRGYLAKALPFPIAEYDPCVPGKEESPKPCDILISSDVCEHLEEDHLPLILADMHRCCKKIAYLVVHTGPSSKFLSDGRNAHILQRNKSWWSMKLSRFFVIGSIKEVGPLLHIVAAPKVFTKKVKEVGDAVHQT